MSIQNRYPHIPWIIIDILGLISVITVTLALTQGLDAIHVSLDTPESNTLVAGMIVFVSGTIMLYRSRVPPGFRALGEVIPIVSSLFGLLILAIVAFRISYSRPTLLLFFTSSVVWFQLRLLLMLRYSRKTFWVIPQGKTENLLQLRGRVRCKPLKQAQAQPSSTYQDGIVTDFRAPMEPQWKALLANASLKTVPIYDAGSIYEAISGRVSVNYLEHNRLGSLSPPRYYLYLKRLIDILLASGLLVLTAPLFAIITLLIRLDSPGSVLFFQRRVTLGGRVFKMFKFRTMTQEVSNNQFVASTSAGDARITRVGAFLRRFRLDELPQLWHVLWGSMSIIGPRPAVVNISASNEQQIPFYQHRHVVRPGITGWAQVSQGYALDEDIDSTREKLERDFYYIKHLSLWLDIMILVMTAITVLSGRGAR